MEGERERERRAIFVLFCFYVITKLTQTRRLSPNFILEKRKRPASILSIDTASHEQTLRRRFMLHPKLLDGGLAVVAVAPMPQLLRLYALHRMHLNALRGIPIAARDGRKG
jgi:hypothetical protein